MIYPPLLTDKKTGTKTTVEEETDDAEVVVEAEMAAEAEVALEDAVSDIKNQTANPAPSSTATGDWSHKRYEFPSK